MREALEFAERDLEMAAEWLPLEEEVWRNCKKPPGKGPWSGDPPALGGGTAAGKCILRENDLTKGVSAGVRD